VRKAGVLVALLRLAWELLRTPWTFWTGVRDQWRGWRKPWP
jgi:hypothetical protein